VKDSGLNSYIETASKAFFSFLTFCARLDKKVTAKTVSIFTLTASAPLQRYRGSRNFFRRFSSWQCESG
jgi:hypothetical protein